MKLMMQPGSALLVMAGLAFAARFVVGAIPVIGGLLSFILLLSIIFGLLGGLFLTFAGRKSGGLATRE